MERYPEYGCESDLSQGTFHARWRSVIHQPERKAINTATSANTVVFNLPFTILSTAGTGTVLSAAAGTMNTPASPNAAVPRNFTFTAGTTITYNAPALSASVLIVSAR